MKSWIQVFSIVVLLICFFSITAFAQIYSNGTGGGRWDTVATWAGGVIPTSTNDVIIVSGDTVNLGGLVSGNCNNLTVNLGGVLRSSDNTRSLTVYGGYIQCDGTIGIDTVTDGVMLQFRNSATTTLLGSGTANIYRIRPSTTTGMTFVFDMNVNIGRGGGVYSNNVANTTFTINPAWTLTLTNGGGGAYIAGAGNKANAGTANYTINVEGTLNVSSGSAINLNTSGIATLNVSGTINAYGTAAINGYSGTPIVNILLGGTLKAAGAAVCTTSTATTSVATGGTVDFSNSGLRNLGTTSISGILRLADGTYPSGTVTLNSGSTVEYYGTSSYTMPASPAIYENLVINNPGGVNLGNTTDVNATLTLSSGALSIGANTLTLYGLVSTTSGSLVGSDSSSIGIYGSGSIALPAITLDNLNLSRSDGLSLSGNVTVGGLLSLMSGIITTGANTLAIDSGGSVYQLGGYVIGRMQKYVNTGSSVNSMLEVGTINAYTPVFVIFQQVSTPGNFGVEIKPGDHPNLAISGIDPTKSLNQYWSFFTDIGADAYDANLNFAAEDIDPGASGDNFVARAYNGSTWSPLTVPSKGGNFIQIDGKLSAGGIIAVGEQTTDSVSITASAGSNGAVSPSGEIWYILGSSPTYTIIPDPGYRVDSVLVDEVQVDSTSSYTFININMDHTIRAVFAPIQFQITAIAGPNGSINPSGVVNVDSGGTQVFTFTPDAGYHVDSVIVNEVKVDSTVSYTFINVAANHTIRAVFAIDQFTISAISGPNGSITPNGDTTVNYGATVVYTITPVANYHVDSLLVDEVKVDSTLSYTFINVSANHTIRAVFAIDQFAITASAGTGGTITPSGTVIVNSGDTLAFTISANVHYQIDSVIVDGAKVDSTTSYTFVNITIPHTIRATFAAIIMSIKSNGTGGGAWNNINTWQGGFVPISSDTVTILGGDTVAAVGTASCRTINVQAAGVLTIPPAEVLTVTSPDSLSIINGTIMNSGTITASGRLQFGNGAIYNHAENGGTIPTGIWSVGSTCLVTGLTSTTVPTNLNQAFYNFTWNNPGQSGNSSLGGNLRTVNGNFTVTSTNGQQLRFSSANANVNIGGNIIVNGGFLTSTGSGGVIDTINVAGSINLLSGTLGMVQSSGSGTWNVAGSFNMSGGTLQKGSGAGLIRFVGGKHHTLSITGGTQNTTSSNGPGGYRVLTNDTLDVGTSIIRGGTLSPFTLDSAATIITSNVYGLDSNITTTGTISLSSYATYGFIGSLNQVTGTLIPLVVANLIVNNSLGVSLNDAVSVTNTLYLLGGKFTLENNAFSASTIVGSSSTNYIVTNGSGTLTIPNIGSTEIFLPIGTEIAYAPLWIANTGTEDAFSVAVVLDTIPPPTGGRVNAKWDISEGVPGGSNCNIDFGWMASLEDAAFAADREANSGIFNFDTDTSESGTGVYRREFSAEPYSVGRDGFTTLGTFAVGKFGIITAVKDPVAEVPLVFNLSQNYPNPFNPTTTIEFTVPNNGIASLTIYNLLGQKVATLFNGEAKAGTVQRVIFNASNLSSGVYFSRLEYGSQKMVRRLMLMK